MARMSANYRRVLLIPVRLWHDPGCWSYPASPQPPNPEPFRQRPFKLGSAAFLEKEKRQGQFGLRAGLFGEKARHVESQTNMVRCVCRGRNSHRKIGDEELTACCVGVSQLYLDASSKSEALALNGCHLIA
jgi:hypothetical protein